MLNVEWRMLNGGRLGGQLNIPHSTFAIQQSALRLHGHDVLFLVSQNTGDFVDVLVGELLDLIESALLVVLGDLVPFEHLLELLVTVAPDLPNGGARLLGYVVGPLDELLAPLLGELRDGDAHHLPVVRGIQPQIGFADGLLNWRGPRLFLLLAPSRLPHLISYEP